jgi:hypothetical protein
VAVLAHVAERHGRAMGLLGLGASSFEASIAEAPSAHARRALPSLRYCGRIGLYIDFPTCFSLGPRAEVFLFASSPRAYPAW